MATSEDQTKPVVWDFVGVVVRLLKRLDEACRDVSFQFFFITDPVPDAVDGFVPGSLDDPCPRRLGNTRKAPLVDGGGESFLCRFFCQFEITGQPNQRSNDLALIGAIDGLDRAVSIWKHSRS